MSYSAGDVMDAVAVLMNDPSRAAYTYTKQLPLLKLAWDQLKQFYELNNLPKTNTVSSVVEITTAMTDWGGSTGPALPTDLVEIQSVWERDFGSVEDFMMMTRCEYLPTIAEISSSLIWWSYQNEIVQFVGATTNRDVMMNYIADTFGDITNETTVLNVINGKNFLVFRTASLCAKFIGENPTRAQELDAEGTIALDMILGLSVKGRQVIATRHRPFMAAYKGQGRI